MEHILEYFGVLTGLLYLLLEIKQHRVMWVVGFLTSLIYVFVFFSAKIYADMGLNAYYVIISMYGFWKWRQADRRASRLQTAASPATPPTAPAPQLLYRHITPPLLAGVLLAIAAIWGALYYILHHFTDSPIPSGDAFTTAVGIVATWMLARRLLEHWLFWIVVNFTCVYLYYLRELYPTMFLYLCYAILAIVGLYTWKKKGTKTDDTTL